MQCSTSKLLRMRLQLRGVATSGMPGGERERTPPVVLNVVTIGGAQVLYMLLSCVQHL